MSASTFDTHAAVRSLEAVDIDTRQAEAIVDAIRSGQGDLATKSDIASVHAEIASVHAEIASVRTELAGVRTEIGTLRWVVGIQSAITLATFAIVAAKLL